MSLIFVLMLISAWDLLVVSNGQGNYGITHTINFQKSVERLGSFAPTYECKSVAML